MTLLSLITYWQFTKFHQTMLRFEIPKFEMPKFEIPEMKIPEIPGFEILGNETPESKIPKEFISPDGKLKLRYPANWTGISEENLKKINQKGDFINSEILFLSQKINIQEGLIVFLAVEKINREATDFDKVIEEIKADIENKGSEVKIVQLDKEKKEAFLEVKSKNTKSGNLLEKEKIVGFDSEYYLIGIGTLERDWPELEKEAEGIFNSIELNP